MNKYHLMLIIVVLIGAFFRLYNLEIKSRFIWDEGRDMLAIRHMIVNKDLTLFGPYNEIDGKKDFYGVFHYYLMAPSLLIANFSPLGPAYFTAILGIISILLCYYLLSHWTSPIITLVVTALYSFSPLVVRYVQWAWNPNTTPFFTLLFLIFLTMYIRKPTLVLAFLAGTMLGLLFQLHYFTLGLMGCWFLVTYKIKPHRWQDVMIFLGAFLLPNFTFVLFDLTHEGFYRKIVFDTLFSQGKQRYISFDIVRFIASPFITTYQTYAYALVDKLLGALFTVGFFVSIGLFLLKKIHPKQRYFGMIVLSGWVGYCLITTVLPNLADDYHTIPYLVGLFYLSIVGLYNMFSLLKIKNYIVLALFTITLALHLTNKNDVLRKADWDENIPLIQKIAQLIHSDNPPASANVASLIDADTRATRFRYFLEAQGISMMAYDSYPNSSTLYVVYKDFNHDFVINPAWELQSFKSGKVTEIPTNADYRLVRIDK